jgi:hypothetical protein
VLRPECLAPGDSRRARAVSRVRQRDAGVPGALGGLGTASCREGLQSGLQSRRRNGWKLLSWNAIGWFELAARRRGRLPPAPRLAPGDLRIAGRFLTPGTRLVEPASAAARRRASRLGFASQEGGLRSQPARGALATAPFGRGRLTAFARPRHWRGGREVGEWGLYDPVGQTTLSGNLCQGLLVFNDREWAVLVNGD